MRTSPRFTAALRCGLALLAATGPLAATPLPLPAELPLDALPLTLELSHAEIEMVVGDAAGHLLRARPARTAGGEAGEPAILDVVRDRGRLTVRRIEGEEGEVAPRLRLDLVVAAGQQVRLAGRDLVVRVEDRPPQAPGDAAARGEQAGSPAAARAPAVFQLALESSEAALAGVRGATLELVASSVWLDGCSGSLAMILEGGSAEIRGHRGEVTLEADGAETVVRDLAGGLAARLAGGRLDVAGGNGKLTATAEEAVLRFEDWRGSAEVHGRDSALEARAPQGAAAVWRLEGRQLETVLEHLSSRVEAKLEGGSLVASDLRGDVQTIADGGTRVELARVQGSIGLHLTGGSEARLSEITGGLAAEVTDSRLDAEGIDQLQLKAARAEIAGRRLARLGELGASDSELELDLREILHDPSLALRGASRARVWLPTPCIVRVGGPAGLVGYAIEVTNCELRLPGQRVTRRQDQLKYGVRPPTVLKVTMDPDAELEVEGGP